MVEKKKGFQIFAHFVMIFIAVCSVAPFILLVMSSITEEKSLIANGYSFFPKEFSLYAYQYLLTGSGALLRSYVISFIVTAVGTLSNLIITILYAYPLSRKELPGRNFFAFFLFFTMLFNAGLVPWYFVIKYTGIMNSIWALVLPGAVPVFNVILLMNFFRGIPKALKEQASIDGVGALGLLFKIYVPLSLPAIATVTLFSVVNHWNNFFDGMLLINSPEKVPLQTYIQSLVVRISDLSQNNLTAEQLTEKMSQRTFNAAKIVVSAVPILAIYPFMQKYFVKGITLGSVKE